MKDLALPDHLPALRAAGVSCFKIEGRKKSPLYVATTTDYYRRLLDGRLDDGERPGHRSRPADRLQPAVDPAVRAVAQGQGSRRPRHGRPPRHADRPGRGGRIAGARAAAALPHRAAPARRTTACRSICRCWANRSASRSMRLWRVRRRGASGSEVVRGAGRVRWSRSACRANHPDLPAGAPVYCSSSQAVKQQLSLRAARSRALYRTRRAVDVEADADRRAR